VSYLPNLSWMEEDALQPYLDAFRELILPATEVLVGSHKTLQDFLLPDWDSERPPSARELAVAAGEHGTRYVLVTGIMLAPKPVAKGGKGSSTTPPEQFIDTAFTGAGDTLAAALAALLAAGSELQPAVGEALSFLDQSLDAGFRPGMGQVVPDRFFWALPPPEEGEMPEGGMPEPEPEDPQGKGSPRRVH
jgi:hydroxymethylpyrimidine/phosphomethylpyrimidine kinase